MPLECPYCNYGGGTGEPTKDGLTMTCGRCGKSYLLSQEELDTLPYDGPEPREVLR